MCMGIIKGGEGKKERGTGKMFYFFQIIVRMAKCWNLNVRR